LHHETLDTFDSLGLDTTTHTILECHKKSMTQYLILFTFCIDCIDSCTSRTFAMNTQQTEIV